MAITKTVLDVVKDNIKPYIDLNAGNIAAVETTSTAAAAHLAGTQIVFKGKLYDVIQDIAQNGTIIVGTNIVAADPLSSDIATLSNVRAELGAHNLMPNDYRIRTLQGITVSRGSDGSLGLTGTVTQDVDLLIETFTLKAGNTYIFTTDGSTDNGYSPDPTTPAANYSLYIKGINGSDAWINAKDNKSARTFTLNVDSTITFRIYVKNANTLHDLTYYPMIRLATDSDPTYQPYAKPNTELTKDTKGLTDNLFENGAVNLLHCNATSNVQTGLTYIVEDDGTVKVSGTNTSNETAQIAVTVSYVDWDSTKRYRISGCPSNGSSSSYRLGLTINKSDGWSRTLTELGDGLEFQLASNETKIKVSINISAGYAISGTLTFKPMITFADVPNSDYAHYVPYCKSNKELTEIKEVAITKYTGTKISTNGSRVYRCGNMVIADIYAIFNGAYSGASSILDITNERDRPLVDNGCSFGSKCSYLNIGNGTIKASDVSESGLVTGQLVWFAKV